MIIFLKWWCCRWPWQTVADGLWNFVWNKCKPWTLWQSESGDYRLSASHRL